MKLNLNLETETKNNESKNKLLNLFKRIKELKIDYSNDEETLNMKEMVSIVDKKEEDNF